MTDRTPFEDFDRFCEERGVPEGGEATAAAFADWLAQKSGRAIVGGPIGEPPTIVAIPDEEHGRRDP